MKSNTGTNRYDIAITGMGIISPVGQDRRSFFRSCRKAVTGISSWDSSPGDHSPAGIACRVSGFDPRRYLSQRQFRRMSPVSRMAVAASIDAMADSGFSPDTFVPDRTGVVMGTSDGPSSQVETFFLSLLENGPRGTQPFYFPETVPNAPASHVAMFHAITGPNTTFCQNMISAENAICYGADLLTTGQVDVVFCGGADEISPMQYDCYEAVGALNRPVRNNRGEPVPVPGSGMVLGEGAAFLVMERLPDARARGARIYGRLTACVLGGGPAPVGHYAGKHCHLGRVIDECLQTASLDGEAIRQLNVSANFSREQDENEIGTLEKRFAIPTDHLSLSPLKYLMGEFGGVGVLRAAASLLSLHFQSPLAALAPQSMTAVPFSPDWLFPAEEGIPAALMTTTTYGGGCCAMIFETAGEPDQ